MATRFRFLVLLVLCLAVQVGLNAQVTANFTIIAPATNCNPAVYTFINNSVGTALRYRWNFGVYPGVNSIFTSPGVTYVGCGQYQVKLVATDANGVSDSIVKTVSIKCSPKARFTSAVSTGCLPLTAGFTSTSIPGSGTIDHYSWDFGDGIGDTVANPTHIYDGNGCKNVTLVITNSFGCSDDTTINNVVCPYQSPVSSFTSNATTSCHAPFRVTYQASSSGGLGPYTYKWICPGGTPATSTAANPLITYNAPGTYNTTLITTDAHGCTDTVTRQGYIFINSDVANFTIDTMPHCAPAKIILTADSNAMTTAWTWSVTQPGLVGQNGHHSSIMTFTQSGNYNICLTINYADGCTAQKCSTIYVSSPPLALFGVSGNLNTCIRPNPIVFTDSSLGDNLSYSWSFPGGSPSLSSSATPPTVVYNQCGVYSAGLTVTNPSGCISTQFLENYLTIPCNHAAFTVAPASGCLPLTSTFNSQASTGSPVSWTWDFGDPGSGTDTSNLQNPTHVYDSPGCHTVTLTTTTAEGCVYVDSLPAAVCAGFKPHANFSGYPPMNCAGKPITFIDSSTNEYDYTQRYWNFHTPFPLTTESTDSSPSYIYNQAGIWDITLIVSNFDCADTVTKDSYVQTVFPVAIPTVSNVCGNPLSVVLDGSGSLGAQSYQWIIIGGTPLNSDSASVVATFPGPGNYSASLNVINDSTACNDLKSVPITITGPKAEFSALPRVGCSPMVSCFSNGSSLSNTYQWRITNDEQTLDTSFNSPSPCFNFDKPGIYNVRLIVGDSTGCTDTVYKPHYIVVSHPSAVFTGAPVTGCAPLAVHFNDASTYKVTGLANWKWNFGDLITNQPDTSLLPSPAHIYNHAGVYSVALTVTDSNGCVSTNQMLNYVVVDKPSITYAYSSTSNCNGVTACFNTTSTGTGLHYQWMFGDSGTSTQANPCHLFTHSGNFNVAGIVTDAAGCTDTFAQVQNVQVVIPHPAFIADTTTATCPPISVSFSNLTTGATPAVTWLWNFGDGQTSTLKNPFHIYASPGLFTVTLVSSVPNGCVDSMVITDYIKISGPTATLAVPPSSGCVPHLECLHAHSTNTVSYTWDFGDGTVMDGTDSICYTYIRTGLFYPQLVLDNGLGCVYAMPLGSLTVNGMVANFKSYNPGLCGWGAIQFTDSSYGTSSVQSYRWDFGDPTSGAQNTSALANPSHYYANAGYYRVIENIVSANGCVDADTQTVMVNKLPLPVVIVVNPGPCGADTVKFLAQTNDSAIITGITWNFGDPASGALNTAGTLQTQHYYNTPGSYTVRLTATDGHNCTADSTATVVIHQKPDAVFTAASKCLNAQPVSFVNTSQYGTTYDWSFGDGTQSNLASPTHTYAGVGSYPAQLIVQNAFCSDTLRSQVNIYSLPAASFTLAAIDYCGAQQAINLTNTSNNASGYSWSFGNGASSNQVSPVVNYTDTGAFNIKLTAASVHGCIDIVSHTIYVHSKPAAGFLVSDVCENHQPFHFTNTTTHGNYYSWSFGDASTSSLFSPQHSYADTGAYIVSLIARTDYCADTVRRIVEVFSLPVADFTLADTALCGPNAQFAITNQSTNAAGYAWNFGNSTSSNDTNPVALYNAAGNFTIQLIARSNHGCLDTVRKQVTVYPKPAAPHISIEPNAGCGPLTVTLSATTTNAASFTWNFGTDAAPVTNSNSSASYTYTDTGSYTLSLYMVSSHQCTDTINMVDTIKVHNVPHAAFDTVINSAGYPYDGLVSFNNLSVNATNYVWSFGDGTTSNDVNPTHTYQAIDTFSAVLIAGNDYGCYDTARSVFYIIKKALYVPNALQPGFDGSNDLVKVWKPLGIGLLQYHAQVFDKWGELLWETDKISEWQPVEWWDGTYQGKPCQQGAYVWKIDAVFLDGSVWPGMTYSKDEGGGTKNIGTITLLR